MKFSKKILWAALLVGVITSWGLLEQPTAHAQGGDVLVLIVNKSNAGAKMDMATARKLILGEMGSWANGTRVLVVLGPPGSTDRATILRKVCGMTESAYTRYEMQASFTGATAATIQAATSEVAVKNTVKANAGAFGFIHKSQVDASVAAVYELP